jgi:hypothetical protein
MSLAQLRAATAVSGESANNLTNAYLTAYGSGPSQSTLTFLEDKLGTVTGFSGTGTSLAAITASLAKPLITETVANQKIAAGSTDQLFAGVSVTDPNAGAETATITLTNAQSVATDANGALAGVGLVKTSAGVYTLTKSTAAGLTTALHNLVFTPTTNGSAVTTNVSLSVTDAATNTGVATTTAITTDTVGLTGAPSFIYSSVGDDTFNGTALAGPAAPGDIFAFTATTAIGTTGADIITNFNINKDALQLSLGKFANTAAVLAATNDSGANTIITLDASSSVTLMGVHKTDLTATNFFLTNG